jgi:hypothetical protein
MVAGSHNSTEKLRHYRTSHEPPRPSIVIVAEKHVTSLSARTLSTSFKHRIRNCGHSPIQSYISNGQSSYCIITNILFNIHQPSSSSKATHDLADARFNAEDDPKVIGGGTVNN